MDLFIEDLVEKLGMEPAAIYPSGPTIFPSGNAVNCKARMSDGKMVVVKFPFYTQELENYDKYRDNFKDLECENAALDRAQGIEGVAQKVTYYDEVKVRDQSYFFREQLKGKTIALVKEFVDGRTLRDSEQITNRTTQKLLEKTIAQLHKIGILGLDLEIPDNILLTPDGKPYLIDLGGCQLDKGEDSVDELKRRDLVMANHYFASRKRNTKETFKYPIN